MRADAFRGAAVVEVRATGTGRERAELVIAIDGRESRLHAVLATREVGEAIAVTGTTKLSLKSLGAREIKAPLGAFSVKDDVEIVFDLRLRWTQSSASGAGPPTSGAASPREHGPGIW